MGANEGWGKRKREPVDWEARKRVLINQPLMDKSKKAVPLWTAIRKPHKLK